MFLTKTPSNLSFFILQILNPKHVWLVIFKLCVVNSFIADQSLVHVSSVYLFLSMNNFLADGWLVGDSKQQASGSLLMPVMNNLHGSHSTVAFVALLPFSNCVLTFLLLPFLRDKPVHRQLPVKVISGASSQLRLSDFNACRLQVLHIDKDYSPIVIYRFAVNYSFVSAWEKNLICAVL